VCKTVNN